MWTRQHYNSEDSPIHTLNINWKLAVTSQDSIQLTLPQTDCLSVASLGEEKK